MSLLHRQLKYGKTSASQRKFREISTGRKEAMGLPRTVMTAVAFILALFSGYIAILYMLPIANPKQILGISEQNYAAAALEKNREGWLRNHLLKPFELRRTYLGNSQAIRAHYVIPEGLVVDLKIEYCARAFIVEAFNCKIVGSSDAQIDAGVGTKQFKFNRVGFFQFKDRLRNAKTGAPATKAEKEGYRIIWTRQ